MAGQSHHYVPQMYLKGFFDPTEVRRGQNVLWRYRPGENPERKGSRKIAEQTDFYDLPELGDDENDIEKTLAEIEGTVACHLRKLRKGTIGLTHR